MGVCLFQLLTGALPFPPPPGQPRRNIQGAVLWDTQKRAPNAADTATARRAQMMAQVSAYYSDLSIARHVYHSTIMIYQSRGMYITLLF